MDETDQQRPLRVKELSALAAARLEELRADGHHDIQPLRNSTRKLAAQPWGAAWMRQLAYCEQEGMELAMGRSLLRHGCVLDIKLSEGRIQGLVSGEQLYELDLHVDLIDEDRLNLLREQCRGQLDSYVALLEGKLDADAMSALCDPESGLLPLPCDWKFSCTCPDWASPCAHAAALVYAAGCLIDSDPSLLFALRGILPEQLLETEKNTLHFNSDSLARTFGIELEIASSSEDFS